MAPEQSPVEGWNYFNYFTEAEEHFQRARGTGLFLMSPLDWALVENWKNSGVPLEAVLRGIEAAFEKWHAKKKKGRMVNSLAYCAQAVNEEAEALAKGKPARKEVAPPFELAELRAFLERNSSLLKEKPGYADIAEAVRALAEEVEANYADLEGLEQRLTVLEEKASAVARTSLTDEELLALRRELDGALRPYRGKMSADQISMLERQYLDRRIQEKAGLPRLSLFYMN